MFKTKKDVDRHVRTALSKLRTENEKNLRGFPIAKLYYKINEYSTAQHYISGFLSVKEDSASAHKLLGQCYLQLKKPDKALASFQRSLQLDPKQHDLLIEVCKLLLADNSINPNKAKYWCDLAEAEKVQHDAVFSLRLKLLNKDSLETKQVEELILKEITSRPNDINLRVRLIRHFIDEDKIMDAFKYAFDLQMKNPDLFAQSGEWYNVVGLTLNKYQQLSNSKKNWDFWLLLIICCEKQVEISFSITSDSMPNAGTTETANLLFSFDQCLYEASLYAPKLCQERELALEFLRHYRGQLCLFAAALIYKREIVQNKNQWNEATKNALPLLLLGYQSAAPDTQELWLKHSRDQTKQLIQLWNREGAFRCSQAGRTLLSCIETPKDSSVSSQVQQILSESRCWSSTDDILAQVRQYCSDNAWRSKLYRILFPNSNHIIKMQTSFLINSQQLAEPNYEIPSYADVETYEEIAQYLRPQSLQHMVYLSLGSENLSDVRCKFFSGLNFSAQNLSFCGAESLNQLDIETFLYATTIQTQRALDVEKMFSENYASKYVSKPKILPFVNIITNLCTEEQMTWWNYAYQVYKNLVSDNLAEVRTTLQYGIEAVRGVTGPKIDLIIVLKLGKIFETRTQDVIKPLEKSFLEARAENLYKYGLKILKLHNKGVLEPFRKLFKYSNSNSSQVEREINALAEEAVTYLAARYFKNSEYEECIEELSGILLPFATYFQAEAYRKLDESNKTPKKTKKIYLDKARDCLNQTLNLLGNSNINANHPLNSIVHSEIKRLQFTNNFAIDTFSNGAYSESVDDFLNDTTTFSNNHNRMRRNEVLTSSPRSIEMENLVKQMASTMTFLKEEFIDVIKPEITMIKKELGSLKEKLETIEEGMKKRSIPPSRDDEPNDLGDLYIIEDELQNQIYGNQQNIYPNYGQHQSVQQPQRIHTPNTLINQPSQHHPPPPPPHHPQAQAANPYNSPMYNPTYSMNYFPQYVMPGPHAAPPPPLQTAPRSALGLNQHSLPFVDHTLNFNLPGQQQQPHQQMQLLPPDNRSNLFGLLTQPSNPQDRLQTSQPVVSSTSNMWNRLYNNGPVEKAPPVNVVITNSDPLPTTTMTLAQPTLSVTIPPQHIKPSIVPNELLPQSQPSLMQHNTSFPIITSITSAIQSVATCTATTLSPISIDSSITFKSKPEENQIPKSPQVGANRISDSVGSDTHNRSAESDYDPRPDFKPVIPLPEEIEVRTGEEDEEVLFCSRAKLFRYVDKEWKERGLGDIKILKNKNDGKIRILMRREQTHKICANHIITGEMNLTQAKNEEKSYIWAANDFADEELKVEKLCVRFKHVETAKEFYNVFTKACDEAKKDNVSTNTHKTRKETENVTQVATNPLSKTSTFNFGKMNTPTKPLESTTTNNTPIPIFTSKTPFAMSTPTSAAKDSSAESKSSPFANFTFKSGPTGDTEPPKPFANIFSSFNKTQQSESPSTPIFSQNQTTTKPTSVSSTTKKDESVNKSVSDAEDEYVPTAEFKPVIPLPDLIEVQTGEENEIVLFEHRAKLLRFDKEKSEWKERGIGNMKILMDKNDSNLVRLVMRREIVHKLCCNQRLTKDIKFKKASNTDCALTWCGQDYSENELNTDILCVRFKTPEICKSFHETILKAQANMKEESKEVNPNSKTQAKNLPPQGFGSQFKPKAGSWNCPICYVQNIAIVRDCVACGSPRDKEETKNVTGNKKSESKFSFGTNTAMTEKKTSEGFGDKFKPKDGTWNCPSCYVQNEAKEKKCIACASPHVKGDMKNDEATNKSANSFIFGTNKTTTDKKTTVGFGDKFKPKLGSWSCNACYLSNTSDTLYCVACESPKDDTVPKKNANQNNIFANIGQNPPKTTFKFGFASNSQDLTLPKEDSSKNVSGAGKFTFGIPNIASTTSDLSQTSASTTKYTFGQTKTSESASTGFSFELPTSTSGDANKAEIPGFSNIAAQIAPTNLGISKISSQPNTLPTFNFSPSATSMFGASKPADSNKTTGISLASKSTGTLPNMPKQDAEQADNIYKLEKKEFQFVLKPKSPGKAKSPLKSGGEDESDGEDVEEENNTYFTPVIPLPDKVDVKTGEENEEALYCHRAKLYRFAETENKMEWKERGLGDVKILRHKETKKLRVVMRREQVLKICLNHVLNAQVDYKRKDDKSWHFIVNDFSEGEIEKMHFCLRFKNKEIAEGFMDAVKKAITGDLVAITEEESTCEQPTSLGVKSSISEDNMRLADELQLSPSFFDENNADCSGCRGCDPDKFVFPEYKDVNKELVDDNPLPLELDHTPINSKPRNSILKQSSLSFAPNKSSSVLTKSELSGTNIFGSKISQNNNQPKGTDPNDFVFSLKSMENKDEAKDKTEEGKFVSGGFLFANSGNTFEKGNTDKAKPIFSSFGSSTAADKHANTFKFAGKFLEEQPKATATTEQHPTFGNSTTGEASVNPTETSFVKENTKSIFGNNNSTLTTKDGGPKFLFGTTLFGNTAKPFAEVTPSFGSVTGGNIFGGKELNVTPVFGSVTGGSIFGGTEFKTLEPIVQTTTAEENKNDKEETSGSVFMGNTFGGLELQPSESVVQPETMDENKSDKEKMTSTYKKYPFAQSNLSLSGEAKTGSDLTEPLPNTDKSVSADNKITSVGLFKSTGLFIDSPKTESINLIESEKSATSTTNQFIVHKPEVSSSDDDKKESETETDTQLHFKTNEDISFASLAAKSDAGGFRTTENANELIGLTNTNAFSSFLKPQTGMDTSLNTGNVSQSDSTQDDSNYDPHYEPIIALPKEIEVKTGEEDEQKLFGERGTLYRYDSNTKEWKERGVGEMKVLYHPEQATYRFLLRREQVHKLVLNHALTADFVLAPMAKSGKAFIWAAQNFAEEPAQLEKLAIRFKNIPIAERFENLVNKCVEELQKRASLEPEED